MPTSDAIFEQHYIYNTKLNLKVGKLDIFWTDCYSKYEIAPVRNGRNISYEVYELDDPLYTTKVFRSKKKAMQYVVAELFTELFDYEHYGFTRDSGLPF